MTLEEIKKEIHTSMANNKEIRDNFDNSIERKTAAGERYNNCKWILEMLDTLDTKKFSKPQTLDELYQEWRFTNEWKAEHEFTTFEQFIKDRNIPYIKTPINYL